MRRMIGDFTIKTTDMKTFVKAKNSYRVYLQRHEMYELVNTFNTNLVSSGSACVILIPDEDDNNDLHVMDESFFE